MSLEDGRFLVESVRYEALKGSMTDSATFVNFDINFDWFKGDQWIGNHNFQHQIEDFLVKCTLNRSNEIPKWPGRYPNSPKYLQNSQKYL